MAANLLEPQFISFPIFVGVLDRNLLRGVPEVDECGLAEIGNSKEETRGTQFRQVRAARCVTPYVL
jgi:hypothetical protein